jgi:hypothetical protein
MDDELIRLDDDDPESEDCEGCGYCSDDFNIFDEDYMEDESAIIGLFEELKEQIDVVEGLTARMYYSHKNTVAEYEKQISDYKAQIAKLEAQLKRKKDN